MTLCDIFNLLIDEIHRRDSIVGSNTLFDKYCLRSILKNTSNCFFSAFINLFNFIYRFIYCCIL